MTFLEIDHEMMSMAILFLLLIKEGQLSVTDEIMCINTSTGSLRLHGLPKKSASRLIGRLDMTLTVLTGAVKPQIKNALH